MFKVLQHLLPNGRAWRSTTDKQLTRFFKGATAECDNVRGVFDTVFDDVQPATTGALDEFDDQFGLSSALTDTAQRRTRLDGAWKAIGGQSPSYIQGTLRAAGFDVYVHEWWEPGTEPAIGSHACAVPRNPLLYLRRDNLPSYPVVDCGEPLAQCGEPLAQCGNSLDPIGYPLVNKIDYSAPDYIVLCGEPDAQCGESDAQCGEFLEYQVRPLAYIVPTDPACWPFFMYIGGQVFGTQATIPAARRDEFEALCLKIRPLHVWVGVLVNFV